MLINKYSNHIPIYCWCSVLRPVFNMVISQMVFHNAKSSCYLIMAKNKHLNNIIYYKIAISQCKIINYLIMAKNNHLNNIIYYRNNIIIWIYHLYNKPLRIITYLLC